MKQATVAAIRFGLGLGTRPQPSDAAALIDGLTGPDTMRAAYPNATNAEAMDIMRRHTLAVRADRKAEDGAAAALDDFGKMLRLEGREIEKRLFARMLDSDTPFRERLTLFWTDHFALRRSSLGTVPLTGAFIDDALRANMTGRFGDMLRAAVLHPQMILYLDQSNSVGPNSRFGNRQGLGLNENLAREVLELHSLGVDGAYTQDDVRQFAELLTGVMVTPLKGLEFRANRAEPGVETILGKVYGHPKRGAMDHIGVFLDDLAVHPDTARHMARKLAVHFVSDTPDPAFVTHIADAWMASGGDLLVVYTAMLEHPLAWVAELQKVRQPVDFIAASMRALGVTGSYLMGAPGRIWNQSVNLTLKSMGQPFLLPPAPDGWPEEAEAWITPLGLATRIRWSMEVPGQLLPRLPDPRAFVQSALGDAASAELVWAVGAAETVPQGVGLVLASPEFNRR